MNDTIEITGQLADRINNEHQAIESALSSAVQHAIKAGELLNEAKAHLAHGEWNGWLKANCSIAERTARGYMRLAKELPKLDDSKRQRVANLPLREALTAMATKRTTEPAANTLPPLGQWAWSRDGGSSFAVIQQSNQHLGYYWIEVIHSYDGSDDGWAETLKKPVIGGHVREIILSMNFRGTDWVIADGSWFKHEDEPQISNYDRARSAVAEYEKHGLDQLEDIECEQEKLEACIKMATDYDLEYDAARAREYNESQVERLLADTQ